MQHIRDRHLQEQIALRQQILNSIHDYLFHILPPGILSLYRLTMGQPRQEELLQLLEGKVTKEQMKELLFDLSPFNRNTKQNKELC